MIGFLKSQLNESWVILRSFKGNARGCLIAEPFWGIPYNMYIGYASVYMIALGCTDVQVGLITAIGLGLQAFFALVSGHVTDKLGRKKTSLIFDIIGWSVATIIWAFAQNFYYFLIASIINSCYRIVHTSWTCLMVEDTETHERVHAFTWIYVAGILAGFFSPVTGFLIKNMELVQTMRGLYLFAFVSMTFMFFLRDRLTTETRVGLIRIEETRGHRLKDVLSEYMKAFRVLFKSPYIIAAFTLMILNNIQVTIKATFLAILLTKGLDFPAASIAVFPAVNSAVMLVIFLFVMPTLGKSDAKKPLYFGFLISIISNMLLILSPDRNVIFVTLSTILGGIGAAITSPFIESVVANSINDNERAKVTSILYMVLFGVTAPFGYIGGYLSSVSEKLPFIFITAVFCACILMVWTLGLLEEKNQRTVSIN